MTDELLHLADALTADYLHGRWRPEATEEHRARILSVAASIDGGLDALAAGGVLSQASIEQMLRPHPTREEWRLTPVLRAYPDGSPEAQALVRDLLDVIAAGAHPDYPRRLDVLEQLRHARPDVTVHDSLQATVRVAAELLPVPPAP